MEPHTSHPTLFFFCFCFLSPMVMTFHSAQAVCVPRNSTYSAASPTPSVLPPAASNFPSAAANPSPQTAVLAPSELQPKLAIPRFPGLVESVPGPSPTANPAFEKICDTTDYPAVCVAAIAPFLDGKTDLISVVELAIKAAVEHTKLAISAAAMVAATPGTPPQMMSILSDIKDSYNDALFNFQEAVNALPARDVGTMNSMLSAAITDFSDCDDDLSGFVSPLLDFNAKLTQLASNCLAIVALINGGPSPP